MIKYTKTATFCFIILAFILTFCSFYYGSISADAPYYLSIARDINDGKVPFKDIHTWYAPMMMYMNALLYFCFGNINYFWFLGFQYFIVLLSAYILFKIAIIHNVNRVFAIFFAVLFYLIILLSEGIYINLEVYVVLFSLLSFFSLLKKRYFLSGLILTLAVFSKQYGFLNFIPFYLYIALSENKFLSKNSFNFGLGGFFGGLLFLTYFVLYQNVSFTNLFMQLSGEDYKDLSITKKFNLIYYLRDAKYIAALLFPLIFVLKKEILNKKNIFIIVGFILNILPSFFQSFPHYFILTYPFIFLFFLLNYQKINQNFIISMVLCMSISFGVVIFRVYKYKDDYTIQVSKAKKYINSYPKNTTVFLDGHIRYLYLLNNYHNPVLQTIGYSYLYIPDTNFKKKFDIIRDED
jgi:hypothetical protein